MMSDVLAELASPTLVARFQKLCGVEYVVDNADNIKTAGDDVRPQYQLSADAIQRHHAPQGNDDNFANYNDNNTDDNNTGDQRKHPSNGAGQADSHVARLSPPGRHRVRDGMGTTHQLPTVQGQCNGTTPSSPRHTPGTDNVSYRESSLSAFSCLGAPANTNAHAHDDAKRQKIDQHGNSNVGERATRIAVRYPFLYYWALVGATLGNEEFYLTGFPCLLWTVDACLTRQTAMFWWLVMYIGQASKDYLGWPRPHSPPVIRLETTHLAEFSMPSTHAMAGTAIPLLLSSLLLERYQLPVMPVLGIAALWCATTCLSRLYLGVHTALDVICGVLLALLIFTIFSPLVSHYDYYQQTHFLAPLILIVTSLALCTVCYPSSSKNSAKGDAIIITAVMTGVGIGAWLNYQLELSVESPEPIKMAVLMPTLSWVSTSILQFIVGVAVLLILKAVVKRLTVKLFCAYYGVDSQYSQYPSVTLGYKYVSYLSVGLAITFFDPLLFTLLGFGRPAYYREVI